MRAEFLHLESGNYIEFENIEEIFIGSKYYWLSFGNEPQKIMTSKYRLVSIEA